MTWTVLRNKHFTEIENTKAQLSKGKGKRTNGLKDKRSKQSNKWIMTLQLWKQLSSTLLSEQIVSRNERTARVCVWKRERERESVVCWQVMETNRAFLSRVEPLLLFTVPQRSFTIEFVFKFQSKNQTKENQGKKIKFEQSAMKNKLMKLGLELSKTFQRPQYLSCPLKLGNTKIILKAKGRGRGLSSPISSPPFHGHPESTLGWVNTT